MPERLTVLALALLASLTLADGPPERAGKSPDQELPPHISRLTLFGERADWSHDGKRLLFLSTTFGDVYEAGRPRLANQKVIIDSKDLPFRCTLETQNFRPPDEKELTFTAYGYQGTEVCGIDLATRKVTNYSRAPDQYDEAEGVFPDGQFTCVECDRDNG